MSDVLSAWLNEQAEEKGWSLRQVARRAGVSHTTVVKIANNERDPGNDVLLKLARAFQVPNEEILRLAGILPAKPATMNDRRMQYRVGKQRMTDRMVELFERLDADEQELVVLLLEKMTGNEPRIIGDAPPEEE